MKRLSAPAYLLLFFVLLKVLLHLFTANTLGFHRDEFLYLELGRHLDWGFWSNPPLIGVISWCSQTFLGESLLATRVPSALAGGGLVLLSGLMVREWGGGRFAQVLCGATMLFSIAWLRTNSMLQPVPFDVLSWAWLSFLLVKWLKTEDPRWWWWIGAAVGIGFLNKYSLVFWVAALLPALLLSQRRKVLLTPAPWLGAGLAALIILPNLIWQWHYNFPVVQHMAELARNQLDHVEPGNFLKDQLLMQGLGGMLVWLAGLVFLLRSRDMQPYRLVGYFSVAVVLIFLAFNGKSYYTLGIYPALIAAGAVYWERIVQRPFLRTALVAGVVLLGIPFFPIGIPIWSAEHLSAYTQRMNASGVEVSRWEDGELHALPQDFADMLGWSELAAVVDSAVGMAGLNNCIIYGENYGQAGAVSHLCSAGIRARTVSFSDSYRLWAPEDLPAGANTLIYINEEMGDDVKNAFADIQQVGCITHPLARERGTCVWICRQARGDINAFWKQNVKEVREAFHLPNPATR